MGTSVEFAGAPNPARGDTPAIATGTGYLARPDVDRGPGVLVLHAWWGLNDTFRTICDRLADAGFAALAPDLYGDGRTAPTIEEAERLSSELDEVAAEQIALGAADWLRADSSSSRVAVLGCSLGAGYAEWLCRKRPDEVAAAVCFYEAGVPDQTTGRAAVHGHFAERDDYEPAEQVEAFRKGLEAAGRVVEFHVYPGTEHWFFEPDRPEYAPDAAELAWTRTLSFLRRELGWTGTGTPSGAYTGTPSGPQTGTPAGP